MLRYLCCQLEVTMNNQIKHKRPKYVLEIKQDIGTLAGQIITV